MGNDNLLKSGITGALAAMLLASCGIKQIEDLGGESPNGRYSDDGRDSNWDRICSKAMIFTSKASMEDAVEKYFFSTLNGTPSWPGEVQDIETPVNWCFEIGSGSSNAMFRIEYEDHFNGGFYQMNATKSTQVSMASTQPILYHASINTTANEIDFIFLDSQGFTQIVGPKVGDYYEAKLKFANLPSQTSATDAYIQEVVRKCQTGEWTVAKCMGYAPAKNFWWEQTSTSGPNLELARKMLAGEGGTEIGTIGTMRFRLSDVLKSAAIN